MRYLDSYAITTNTVLIVCMLLSTTSAYILTCFSEYSYYVLFCLIWMIIWFFVFDEKFDLIKNEKLGMNDSAWLILEVVFSYFWLPVWGLSVKIIRFIKNAEQIAP